MYSGAGVLFLSITSVVSFSMRLHAFARHGYNNPFLDHPRVTERTLLNLLLGLLMVVPIGMYWLSYVQPTRRFDWVAPSPLVLTALVFSRVQLTWLLFTASVIVIATGVMMRAKAKQS